MQSGVVATTRSFGFSPVSVLLLAALHAATSLQRLLLHYKHSRVDRANGPEQLERLPSRLGSSLMQRAAVASGGECTVQEAEVCGLQLLLPDHRVVQVDWADGPEQR